MSLKSPEFVMRAALVSASSFTALAGSRVYPLLAPAEDPLPYVTWSRTGISREQTLGAPMGVPRLTVEYQIVAQTYQEARGIADVMRSILDGYGGTLDNTVVRQVSLEDERDGLVVLDGSEVPNAYSVTQSYDVWWQET